MRILVWLLPLCAALSACNMAISDHPMLTGEPRSDLKVKNGLWAFEDSDCKVDTRRPVRRWPKCAGWVVIKDGKVVDGPDPKPGEVPFDLVVMDGKPPILEYPLEDDGDIKPKGYAYVAIEPAAHDAGGVTRIFLWLVACGTEKVPGSTRDIVPYPGIDKNCHPESTAALQAAAVASRPKTDEGMRMKWVRANAN